MVFKDRSHAGQLLGNELRKHANSESKILGLPRGGVVVAHEVAKMLHLPLNVITVRKLGLPQNPEFGFGAISEGGIHIMDEESISTLDVLPQQIDTIIELEKKELLRKVAMYRNGQPLPGMKGRQVILIDDGIATGLTAIAAIRSVRKLEPEKIVFAAPVCAPDSGKRIRDEVDELVCLLEPQNFRSVGQFYTFFEQTKDEEVISLLNSNS